MEDKFTTIVLEGASIDRDVIDQLKKYQSQAQEDKVHDIESIELAILFLIDRSDVFLDEDLELLFCHLSELSGVIRSIRKLL